MIQPIVEGHGEVPAVPILIRKLGTLMGIPYIKIGRPIRRPRSKLIQKEGFIQAVELAKIQSGCRAIIILFDADDFCPKEKISDFQGWAAGVAQPCACSVVMPNREYEGWFLACIEVIMKSRGLPHPIPYSKEVEAKRNAKGAIEEQFGTGFRYLEKVDQPAFTEQADWALVYHRSRSFRKMVKETIKLFRACGCQPMPWPPPV